MLPYLEIKKNTDEKIETVQVPELRNLTITEAKKTVKDFGLQIEISNKPEEIKENKVIIKEQSPKPGIKVQKENKILVEI